MLQIYYLSQSKTIMQNSSGSASSQQYNAK